jgi:hypothetical protein
VTFTAPSSVPEPSLGAWGTCECGCPIWTHGRHNQDGNQVWVGCRHCDDCTTFKASDGSQWPNVYSGAAPSDPTDLDRNTDHWIDGQVYLTGDEPPL